MYKFIAAHDPETFEQAINNAVAEGYAITGMHQVANNRNVFVYSVMMISTQASEQMLVAHYRAMEAADVN